MLRPIIKIYQVKRIYLLLLKDIKVKLEKFVSELENKKGTLEIKIEVNMQDSRIKTCN